MKNRIPLLLLLCLLSLPSRATHIYGGGITYKYLGSFAPNTVRYEVTLTLYEDCLYGYAASIRFDDTEYINFFNNLGNALYPNFDSMMLTSRTQLVSSSKDACNFPPPYNSLAPKACLQKAVFVKSYDLPIIDSPGATYTAAVQLCCLNASIANIIRSSDIGITFSATIPADTADTNSGAVFKNDPFYYTHINAPLNYDASATDADGDSLSYEFCTGYTGGTNSNAKPAPLPPPYTPVPYAPPFSYSYPITSSPAVQIDARTGLITGTPTALGRYLVVVCCHEWRNGININTTYREVQMIVTDCIKGAGVSLLSVAQEQLKVYSSPSAVKIGFKEGAGSILVTDVVGRTMYASTLRHDQNSIDLPTNAWNNGMYIVRLTYPGIGKVSTKFVVE